MPFDQTLKTVCRDCKVRIKEIYKSGDMTASKSFAESRANSMYSQANVSIAPKRDGCESCQCEIF